MTTKEKEYFTMKDEPEESDLSSSILEKKDIGKPAIQDFKLYKIRWPIVLFFSSSMIAGGLAQIGLSPIMSIIKEIYGKDGIIISLLVLPFTIFFIPLMYPANYLIEKYGITIPIYIACITLVIGAWIRMLVNTSFYFLLAGQ